MSSVRDRILDDSPEDTFLFMDGEEFDAAIVGVAWACWGDTGERVTKIVYDWQKVIDVNMQEGMTYDEAVEFFDFNQGGAYVGKQTPIFVHRVGVV